METEKRWELTVHSRWVQLKDHGLQFEFNALAYETYVLYLLYVTCDAQMELKCSFVMTTFIQFPCRRK